MEERIMELMPEDAKAVLLYLGHRYPFEVTLWGSITLSRSLTCNVMAGAVAVMLLVRTGGSVRPGPFAVVFSPSSGRRARWE
jgi:hypothetical protein